MELTHASFFSGAGGLDMGLERAGWRTVSFSEIEPYACAVLAERWPGVPNIGSITAPELHRSASRGPGAIDGSPDDWTDATLWTGGFPCQDLSVAGKRRGMVAGTRSNLAHAFLDLVERHRPPALILENVPGLLSSNKGRDFYALQRRMAELGYVGAYRVCDSQFFGVPQRRRRVFIVALDARRGFGADSAAEVLSVGSRCHRHPPTGVEAGWGAAAGARGGVDIARTITGTSGKRHDEDIDTLVPVGPSPDAGGVRATDGLAGGPHDRGRLADSGIVQSLDTKAGGVDDNEAQAGHLVVAHSVRPRSGMPQGWNSNFRVDTSVGQPAPSGADDLLPLGLDSHRYRLAGNGVVSTVPEWFGPRLADILAPLGQA